MLRHSLIALTLATLVGCYSPSYLTASAPKGPLRVPPSPDVIAAADFGIPPSGSPGKVIEAAMSQILKDPESARYRFTEPVHGWFTLVDLDERTADQPYELGHVFGWKVAFGVNAKNSYGGYGGEKAYTAFFVDGKLRGILQRGKYKDIHGYVTWDLVLDALPLAAGTPG